MGRRGEREKPFSFFHFPFSIFHFPFSIFHFPFFHFPFSIFYFLFSSIFYFLFWEELCEVSRGSAVEIKNDK
jgi:hypothetical protein